MTVITDTADLARLLMRTLGLEPRQFAPHMNMSAAAIVSALKPRRSGRRNMFHLRTVALGLIHGHEREALSVLFERHPEEIPTIQIASFMYPDLTSCELAAIRHAEGREGKLPSDRIRSIVDSIRSVHPIREEFEPLRNAA